MSLRRTCGVKRAAKGSTQTENRTQTSNTTQANTYGYMPGAESADIDALRNFQFQHDPRIPHAFARQRSQARQSYANPMGGYTTPQLRDSVLRATDEDSAQNEAQALREESHGLQGLQFAGKQAVAGMTAPRLVQTGGTGSSTGTAQGTIQTQQPFMDSLNPFISGGASMGAAMIA